MATKKAKGQKIGFKDQARVMKNRLGLLASPQTVYS
jgi:hypothetical protein